MVWHKYKKQVLRSLCPVYENILKSRQHVCILCTTRQVCLSYFSRQSWWTPRSCIWSARDKAKPSMLYVTCCTESERFHCGLKMRNTEHFGRPIAICSSHSLAHSVMTVICYIPVDLLSKLIAKGTNKIVTYRGLYAVNWHLKLCESQVHLLHRKTRYDCTILACRDGFDLRDSTAITSVVWVPCKEIC